MSPSLLNVAFLLLLVALVTARWLLPVRLHLPLGAVGSAVVLVAIRRHGGSSVLRKVVFALGVSGLVALMLLFKVYQRFTLPFLNDTPFNQHTLALFGFSYFLFRAIDFLYMQYLLDFVESPLTVLYYGLFPPTLTSGPIQRFLDFRDQVARPTLLDRASLTTATYRITRGFFRKLCLASLLNKLAAPLLALPSLAPWQSVATIVSLYLFFYFDFAGYSDIAIGFGLLLGIRVPENFKRPFTSTSLTEFWRNYHITLGDWLRNHVFIPLGGMRASKVKAGALAALVMLLCAMWHGLTTPFLIWGVWHAGHLYFESVVGPRPIPRAGQHGPRYWLLVLWTNTRVALGALLFMRSPQQVLVVLRGLL